MGGGAHLIAPRRLFALLSVMKPRGDPFGDSGRPRDCLFTTEVHGRLSCAAEPDVAPGARSIGKTSAGRATDRVDQGGADRGPVRSKRRVTGTPAATPPPSPRDRRALRKRSTARTQPGHDQLECRHRPRAVGRPGQYTMVSQALVIRFSGGQVTTGRFTLRRDHRKR